MPETGCLQHQFERQVDTTPERVAVECEGVRLTYRALDQAANRLAHWLIGRGVGGEDVVALSSERSPELLVGVWGVLKAGAAYLPLDPAHPASHNAGVLDDGGARLILAADRLAPELSAFGRPVRSIASALAEVADATRPAVAISPDCLAYVIYTSGTTGRPKGVAIQHRSALHFGRAMDELVYRGRGPLRVGMNSPMTFDPSVKQWLSLLLGHTLCLVPERIRKDPNALLAFLDDAELDVLDCTPSYARGLLACGLATAPHRRGLILLVGGEAVDAGLWATLSNAADLECFDMYGPTEVTVDATSCLMRESAVPTVGRAIPGAAVYLLDRGGVPVPSGSEGEIFVGGAGVGRGYHRRPDLTAERFIPDPFSKEPGARMYRSGDVGWHLQDGLIAYGGRIDHQVKVRGHRVELESLEARLNALPNVRQACVLDRRASTGEVQLLAFLTLTGGDTDEARAALAASVPEYMVPSQFIALEALPLNSHGKVDRTQLREWRGPAAEKPRAPERTPLERVVGAIWCDLLEVEEVSRSDDFFAIGGSSLLAFHVLARLKAALEIEIPIDDLFTHRVLDDFALRLGQIVPGPELERAAERFLARRGP